MAKQQKFTIKVDKSFNESTREAIAKDVIDHILERTKKDNADKNGAKFPGYSKGYIDSFDFGLAGKSDKKVNLTLSGEMLNAMRYLESSAGEITIGIPEDDDFNNEKAEGNIKGTYGYKPGSGRKKPIGKKRDFMGIQGKELESITEKYKEDAETATSIFNSLVSLGSSATSLLSLEGDDNGQ